MCFSGWFSMNDTNGFKDSQDTQGSTSDSATRSVLCVEGVFLGFDGCFSKGDCQEGCVQGADLARLGQVRLARDGYPRGALAVFSNASGSARADASAQGARANCGYHGARTSGPNLRRSSSARPSN